MCATSTSTAADLRLDLDIDLDHELILVVAFREAIKLRGIKFLATEAKTDGDADASAPQSVKVFLHRPHYSFSKCEAEEATENITLTPKQVESGEEVRVKYVKFQNVSSLTIFLQKNQDDTRQRQRRTPTLRQ
jgi:hypothetical protein